MTAQPVLIAGEWRAACAMENFRTEDPAAGRPLPDEYPVSVWADCGAALTAAAEIMPVLRATPPARVAHFLTLFAGRIEGRAEEIVEFAHRETALPRSPRLMEVELPRTAHQLRQAAAAAAEGSWALPTIDTKPDIRSCYIPLGPVCVFGPNNFPPAFNNGKMWRLIDGDWTRNDEGAGTAQVPNPSK